MKICEYGCGQEAKFQFKNGKWCCSKNISQCSVNRQKISIRAKKYIGKSNPFYGKKHTKETKKNISKNRKGKLSGIDHPLYGIERSIETKEKISDSNKGKCKGKVAWNKGKTYEEIYGKEKAKRLKENQKNRMRGNIPWNSLTIEYLKQYHPLFYRIEKMRYKPDSSEIQVHCKNHNCLNSKEKGGWFTPTKTQIQERIRQIEYSDGGCYFYCSDECKDECPLYRLRQDPFIDISSELFYTPGEYQTFRKLVLERDKYICQYCGNLAEHIHHERPQKLEPFFSLDPDLTWSVCKKCHYEKGHKEECSTSKIASKICNGDKLNER